MSDWLAKVGIYTKRKDPAVLFIGSNEDDFANAAELIDKLSTPEIRLTVVLLCLDGAGQTNLSRQYPTAYMANKPSGGAATVSALLSTLKVRVVVCLTEIPDIFGHSIRKRATPVVSQNDVVRDPSDVTMKNIIRLAGQERKWEERQNRPIGRFIANRLFAKLQRNDGQVALGGKITRFQDVEALKARLENPAVIMCLGNGPSSEDTQLATMEHDALFRANHVWMSRNFLDQPDVVFTGMQASMKKIRRAILIVLGDTTEKVLLMTRAMSVVRGQLDYAVVGGTSGITKLAVHDDFRPTSGAIMLSVAVALEPKRLIIAGMDMFRHTDGAYPGDNTTTNAYTATHDHDHELAFILDQLGQFKGELVIVSDVLQAEWDAHRKLG